MKNIVQTKSIHVSYSYFQKFAKVCILTNNPPIFTDIKKFCRIYYNGSELVPRRQRQFRLCNIETKNRNLICGRESWAPWNLFRKQKKKDRKTVP